MPVCYYVPKKEPGPYQKYFDCADFSKCTIEGWSLLKMQVVKGVFVALIGMNLVVTFMRNKYFGHMFFFFSYWGDIAAFLAGVFQIKASYEPKIYGGVYQMLSVVCQEVACGLEFCIVPLFWGLVAPKDMPPFPWHGLEIIDGIHFITTHSWPIISCCVNTYLTKDMTMIREDRKILFWLGIIYIYANWLGTQVEGAPMYPIADWTNIPLTISLYFLLAVLQALSMDQFTKWLNSKRPKKGKRSNLN